MEDMEVSDVDNATNNDEDDKDDDFNIKDYQDDIDSDESFEGFDNPNDGENEDEYEMENNESDEEYTGPILPGGHRFDKKFLCVKYPGVVVNAEKAIETLGGLGGISTAVNTPNRRLELRFRPSDGYSKPACGDRHQTAGFLLRVRVKKSQIQKIEESAAKANENENFNGPFDLSKLDELLGDLGKGIDSSETDDEKIRTDQSNLENLMSTVKNNYNSRPVNKNENRVLRIQEKSVDKNEKDSATSGYKDDYQLPKVKVLGRVETEFKFQNLCDFQYLPIEKSVTEPSIDECIYDSVFPSDVPPYRWLKNKVPYFLPPPAFSRMDSVQQYSLKTESDKGPVNVIGKTRKRRAGFSNFIHFTTPGTPTEPPPGIETAMKCKFLQQSHVDRIKKIFDERPVWSKNGLMCVTNFTVEQLKFLLPSVAYYFMTGPWRVMWVRLGYDPRKDPHAKKYQTLDYRLKAMHGLDLTVKSKRGPSEYTLPYKSTISIKPKTTILTSMQEENDENQKKERQLDENCYIYRDGIVPPSRQMFYQYCDVHVNEIQEMLAKLPNHWQGTKCHDKRGWLPIGFSDQCREIINRQVRAVLRKQMNIPEDHPTSLPPKRKIRKNIRLGKLTIDELKMSHRKKRKDPEDSDEDGQTDAAKKKKSTMSTT